MYLISLYFDQKTNKQINNYINNCIQDDNYMKNHHIPPHLTISAFYHQDEKRIIEHFKNSVKTFSSQSIYYVAVGTFFPHVIYITPVLNQYLMTLSLTLYQQLKTISDISFQPYYLPYQWLPHTTIGKRLTPIQMQETFHYLQKEFVPFYAKIEKIGLSKTNPYQDLLVIELK